VLMATEGKEDLEVLTEMIETGSVRPIVGRTYPLIDAPEAVRYVGEGHANGKVVVTV